MSCNSLARVTGGYGPNCRIRLLSKEIQGYAQKALSAVQDVQDRVQEMNYAVNAEFAAQNLYRQQDSDYLIGMYKLLNFSKRTVYNLKRRGKGEKNSKMGATPSLRAIIGGRGRRLKLTICLSGLND